MVVNNTRAIPTVDVVVTSSGHCTYTYSPRAIRNVKLAMCVEAHGCLGNLEHAISRAYNDVDDAI